jgi:hypothetical protein
MTVNYIRDGIKRQCAAPQSATTRSKVAKMAKVANMAKMANMAKVVKVAKVVGARMSDGE